MVPRNDAGLVPRSADRIRQLHRHLVAILLSSKAFGDEDVPTAAPEPEGFAARVVSVACSLCKGSCCTSGGNDAFLSESTMTRVRRANPELDIVEVAHLYIQRMPDEGYEESCVFHGRKGCTLDRSLRSDVCNEFFCAGLGTYLKGETAAPVTVIAGEGDDVHTSPDLTPDH